MAKKKKEKKKKWLAGVGNRAPSFPQGPCSSSPWAALGHPALEKLRTGPKLTAFQAGAVCVR